MEQQYFKYPSFQKNQFLTSQELNELFQYLEEQERLTRSLLDGNGIIAGLGYTSYPNEIITEITINAGAGVTTDGHLVSYKQAVKYTHTRQNYTINITNPDNSAKPLTGILLLTEAEATDGTFTDNPKPVIMSIAKADLIKYNLIIYVELKDIKQHNCNLSDCNINGGEKQIIYRPILVPVEINTFEIINTFYQPLGYLLTTKPTHTSSIKSVTDFNDKITAVYEKNRDTIKLKLDELVKNTLELPINAENPISTYNAIPFVKNESLNQLYLSFQADLQTAINEFINAYNNFIAKYKFTANTRKSQILVLGQFPSSNADVYRYQFTRLKDGPVYTEELAILSKLYKRIVLLIKTFTTPHALKATLTAKFQTDASKLIRIIPCRGYSAKLGNRAIPYYYNCYDGQFSNLFYQNWRAHELDSNLDMVYNYFDPEFSGLPTAQNTFAFNLPDYNFYRIEGHLGLPIDQAYTALKNLISKLDIPIQLLRADISNSAWDDFRTKYQDFITWYVKIVKELNTTTVSAKHKPIYDQYIKKFNNLKTSFSDTSYKDGTNVKSHLNDFNSYYKLILSAEGGKSKADLDKEVASIIIEIFKPHSDIFKLRDELYKKIPVVLPNNEINLSQTAGIDYQAGAYKGNSFVLVHNGNNVVGDFTLPFYYNLEKDRFIGVKLEK